jgi:hypothetical protein
MMILIEVIGLLNEKLHLIGYHPVISLWNDNLIQLIGEIGDHCPLDYPFLVAVVELNKQEAQTPKHSMALDSFPLSFQCVDLTSDEILIGDNAFVSSITYYRIDIL